ncbi:MAG: hypothetical protein WAU39_01880 [Polyangiales bacterium]
MLLFAPRRILGIARDANFIAPLNVNAESARVNNYVCRIHFAARAANAMRAPSPQRYQLRKQDGTADAATPTSSALR